MAWINAESGPVVGLAELARQLGLGGANDMPEHLAAAAVRLLESDGRSRRLVVFDNVDDPDAISEFLPAAPGDHPRCWVQRWRAPGLQPVTVTRVDGFGPVPEITIAVARRRVDVR